MEGSYFLITEEPLTYDLDGVKTEAQEFTCSNHHTVRYLVIDGEKIPVQYQAIDYCDICSLEFGARLGSAGFNNFEELLS